MTLTRYQIRNEYGLADEQLYQSTDKEDPEALFQGSSMAGLVGVLRQLGDLAEFAGEVFHCLHEELMTTASRGHGLAMRLQQLETELPSVEIPVLSQTDHSTFFYESGLEWHSTLQREENLISRRKLPHCIMDSYEECRGPPELYLLDKFDVVGSGSCLKRYSDPSVLKTSAVVKLSEDERPKKKVSHTARRERLEDSHAKLHQLFLLEHVENGVTNTEFHVKLKRRHPINSSSGTSYMERFLKNSLPYCERVHVPLDQSSLGMETEVTTSNGDTRKERKKESIADDERGENLYTDSETKEVDSDDKPAFGQTVICADVTQTEVLAQCSNVLKDSLEEAESSMLKFTEVPVDASEDGAKVLPKGYVEETESEMSLTALVEDQFSSITNQEMEIESDCLLIQNQNNEDLSLDPDETSSQGDPHESLLHDQGQESQSESLLPPQDGSPSEEALTCNEDHFPSSVTEIEAPHQETFTSLTGHISDQENCLAVSTVPSSTSLHETPQADTETTPPLPPLPPTQWWMGAMSTSAQTTLNEPSKETEEQSPLESFSTVSLLTAEATPEEESTICLEALEWFSQNLREHTNPNLANLEEEPQLDHHPLEPPGEETEQYNNSYEHNEKIEKDSLVIGIDRSMLRKVSERNKTQVGARMEETDSLLEIIRSKSFNLRPADASVRHNFQVALPITNLKVAAILEKANTLRHAMAGSDDDHDSDSWSE